MKVRGAVFLNDEAMARMLLKLRTGFGCLRELPFAFVFFKRHKILDEAPWQRGGKPEKSSGKIGA